MRIRSITAFCDVKGLAASGAFAQRATQRLTELGFEVQTRRAALPPVPQWLPDAGGKLLSAAQVVDERCASSGFDYVSIGPLLTGANPDPALLPQLAETLAQTQRVFASAVISGRQGGVLGSVLPHVARCMQSIALSPPTGFNNLRFCALANCGPGIPFFPAAYALPGKPQFALAMECADLAIEAVGLTASFNDAQTRLARLIEFHAARIDPVMEQLGREAGIEFLGCDWSLAPHPDIACSIGAAIEKLSGVPVGDVGTLTAVATLTRGIQSAKAKHVGFSGVFLPVLEDKILAQRAAEGRLDLQHLLHYCSVCGTGLDTIPLVGEVSETSISALLGDVASIAAALDKPLTVRLMPVPGLKAGGKTAFDFPFLVNTSPLRLETGATGPVKDERLMVGRMRG